MMKRILISGLIGILSYTSFAQEKIKFVEYDLPNGMHVILHEEKSTPIVAVSVLYHVGSKNEKSDRTGFAHFFEHLLFEGTKNIERGEYAKIVERAGGTLNANTSMDRTYYFELLPSNQLELGLWLESERLLHAKVENVGIETQRSVVKEEKRMRVDNQPYATFFTEMFKRMFTDHPYNWQPIGSMEHLDAAQEEDYVGFYHTFYVPSNATLSIAGDIDVATTKKLIDKYFATIPSGQALNMYRDFLTLEDAAFTNKYGVEKSVFGDDFFALKNAKAKEAFAKFSKMPTVVNRPNKNFTPLNTVIKDVVYDNIQLPALFVGYQLPDQKHPDFYALEMMNKVLSGGSSSRMNKEIVERKELAMQAFSFAYGLEDAGIGLFAAIANKDVNLEDIQVIMDQEIEKIKGELISEEEFTTIRNQMENSAVSSYSTVAGICESLADSHVYYGSANYVNEELGKYLAVTREDIKRVANKYLNKDARVILHYLPKADK